ncbi:MAG: hypothetical protein FWH02_06840 [Oscillospiraceae bacterium]|nr:hypothetical protein [Oscillospiraceae bacterium]
MPKNDKYTVYKTEDQLKAEAAERKRVENLLAARRKPPPKAAKKAENYWYHYKWATIAGVFIAVVLVMFIRDVAFRPGPDITIIMVTTRFIPIEYIEDITLEMESRFPDYHGEGKGIKIAIDSIPLSSAADDDIGMVEIDMAYNFQMKLMALIAAGADPLFILDPPAYMFLNDVGSDFSLFKPLEGIIPGAEADALPVSATALDFDPVVPYLARELSFYYRELGYSERKAPYFEACMDFLAELADGA